MEREKVKAQIDSLLQDSSDSVLNEVLNYLNTVKEHSSSTIELSQNLRHILHEDKELLHKLAQ